MNWKNLLIPPIAIYAAISIWIVALGRLRVDTDLWWVWVIGLIITAIGLCLAARYIRPSTLRQGFIFSLSWLAIFVILDIILAIAFAGIEYFYNWKVYLPYALTLLIPSILWKLRFHSYIWNS